MLSICNPGIFRLSVLSLLASLYPSSQKITLLGAIYETEYWGAFEVNCWSEGVRLDSIALEINI